MDKTRLEALLAEAVVDCYDEEEEFVGVLTALGDQLNFPLLARALGDDVTVIGLNDSRSDLRRGIVARVRKAGREYNVALSELEFVNPDAASAEWLEVYRYWLGEGGSADDEY
jgi:hypothetical protein